MGELSYSYIKYKLHEHKENHPVQHKCFKIMMWILLGLLALLLLILILLFVVFPIVFMCSLGVERMFVFWNIQIPKNPNFTNPEQYNVKNAQNFYITSRVSDDSEELISIGAWFVPQESYIGSDLDMTTIIRQNKYPVLLYNHGVLATRILKFDYIYGTLRKYFNVIAIDYRNYGDSTSHDLTEMGVVLDAYEAFLFAKKETNNIYVWGHSLGTGISAHMVKYLKEQNMAPKGLVLESPFSCLEDELYEFPLAKYFRWLPYFKLTFADPLRNHGFIFNSTKHVQDIDVPIMIMHAEDDNVINFKLGEKLYNIAKQTRKEYQGKRFFHKFEKSKGYGHVGITQDNRVPIYIEQFLSYCQQWNHDRSYP